MYVSTRHFCVRAWAACRSWPGPLADHVNRLSHTSRLADLVVVRNEDRERLAWRRTAAKAVKPSPYVRIDRALSHPSGALLLRQRPLSRRGRWHDRIACWILVDHGQVVARRSRYGRRHPVAPLRWATRQLRRIRGATGYRACPHVGVQPGLAAPAYTELPARLVEVRGRGNAAIPREVYRSIAEHTLRVPALIPTVPPMRTIYGEHARHVLSQDEYDLYLETWTRWVDSSPDFAGPGRGHMLAIVCIETVLQYRLALLSKRLPIHRWSRLYHASYRRQQAAREWLGATRRQRLQSPASGDGMNIAVLARMVSKDAVR